MLKPQSNSFFIKSVTAKLLPEYENIKRKFSFELKKF